MRLAFLPTIAIVAALARFASPIAAAAATQASVLPATSREPAPTNSQPQSPAFVPDRLLIRFLPLPAGAAEADRAALPGIVALRRLIPNSIHVSSDPTIDGLQQVYVA